MFKGLMRMIGRGGRSAATGGKRVSSAAAARAAAGSDPHVDPDTLPEDDAETAELITDETGAFAEIAAGKHSDDERTLFFKAFPRPRILSLKPRDVDLNVAKLYADKARRFFAFPINLTNQNSVFYEESEAEYIEGIYGNNERTPGVASDATPKSNTEKQIAAEDRYFVGTLTRMRRTTNHNTSVMFLRVIPLFLTLSFLPLLFVYIRTANAVEATGAEAIALSSLIDDPLILASLAILAAGFAVTVFSYFVSYKNQQIRNTMNFNGYIETRLNRINTIRAEALKEAQNAEKDRTNEAETITAAVSWTLCFHWMIWRTFLNEHGIRNILFQIRRNSDLYKWGSFALLAAIGGAILILSWLFAGLSAADFLWLAAGVGTWFGVVAWLLIFPVFADPAGLVEGRFYSGEWLRFHTSGIDKGIEDQIRRDKREILLYRNRFKSDAGM
ncbi:hypothetical protein L5876_02320 [Hyphobacterium sp. SN044]|uniref:hypothetical protein n=1 Tax=Hyphobacterium sp. SN044 TaxID=2912575 RepID=UPI001F3F3BAB|nr:hypothetical protein [Hyphobacterium sp. SN044]MCF8878643.1 hypothetical protein [Hyphobacterium sp. SN044]